MPSLDVRNAILCLLTTHVVLAVVLLLCYRFQRTHDGFQCWVAQAWLSTFGFLALLLYPYTHAGSIVIVNLLLFTSVILALDGARRFVQGRPLGRAWYAVPVAMALAQGYFSTAVDDIRIRMGLAAVVSAGGILALGLTFLRGGGRESQGLYRAAASIQFAYLGLSALHGLLWALGEAGSSMLDAGTLQALFFLGLSLLDPCSLLMLLLLNSQRIQGELLASARTLQEGLERLRATQAEVHLLSGILPICANCKQIRDPEHRWHPLDNYLRSHTQADFVRRVCPGCG